LDLLLGLEERDGRIVGVINYDSDLLDEQTIQRWIAAFAVLLRGMTAQPESRLADLPILSELERRTVLERFNATQMPYARDRLVHELFERQVERTPNATALAHGRQSLTYG